MATPRAGSGNSLVGLALGLLGCVLACAKSDFSKNATPLAALQSRPGASAESPVVHITLGDQLAVAESARFVGTIGRPRDFASVTALAVVGERLLVADQLTDPHLSVFDRRSGAAEHSLGRHGLAFRQIVDPMCLEPAADAPPLSWLYDFTQQRMLLVQLDVGEDAYIRESIPLKPGRLSCAVWGAGRLIAITQGRSSPAVVLLDRDGRELTRVSTSRGEKAAPIPSALAARPDGRRVVVGYHNSRRVDVLHTTGLLASTTLVDAVATNDGARDEVISLAATDQFFYALVGKRPAPGLPPAGTRVNVFRWNGSLARVLEFSPALHAFAVDGDDTELFAAFSEASNATPLIGRWALSPMPHHNAHAMTTDAGARRSGSSCARAVNLACH